MKEYLFRLLVYFVKPLLVWWIVGYFGFQSVKAVAYAISNYERGVRKAELQARREGGEAQPSEGKRRTRKPKGEEAGI